MLLLANVLKLVGDELVCWGEIDHVVFLACFVSEMFVLLSDCWVRLRGSGVCYRANEVGVELWVFEPIVEIVSWGSCEDPDLHAKVAVGAFRDAVAVGVIHFVLVAGR